ncbi:amidohydrolase [Mycetocola manganoxydans]|uniref:Amidohydrolase n=1 Tax=Mycetocola manganoxydans TaxID=699879 RepID=A0A3L6ZX05_9MICO|nr:amidohydrolase [Mycetocola manganoxydans]RLP71662.1 amidohydrolase [Mycetocola manganoxydans]GHD38923.1 amidohydrolase [Mycetocola manganoxydans]
MTNFRLRASRPGSGIRRTLTGVRIAGLGDDVVDVVIEDATVAEIRPSGASQPDGETTNGDGRWLLPGLWDSHVHFTQWAQISRRFDLGATRSAREVLDVVAANTVQGEDGPAVGFGFRDALWSDAASLGELDGASHGRAVILIAADLHCVWLNSAALHQFGHPGSDSGLLREEDAFTILRTLDTAPDDVVDGWVNDAANRAASRGVVGINDFEMSWNLSAWTRRIASGTIALRARFGVYPRDLDQAIAEGLRTGDILPHTHGLLEVGPLKVITDGSLNTRTAYCVDEYTGVAEHTHGVLTVPTDEFVGLMSRARDAGLESAIHAIGDRANSLVLDAFEATGSHGSVEHAQLLSPGDVARFATLGVTASVQPEHAMDDRDVAERYWEGRTGRAFMLRSLLDAGGTLALGSDAPVAPLDPWVAIASAVGRSRDGRAPWHPEQSISIAEALAASTRTGNTTVRAGQPADLVLVEQDPYAATPDSLRRMPVAATILNGRDTYTSL